jgi:hypothetical protein
MPTTAAILADLKSKGKEGTRKIDARHGLDADRVYALSVADMTAIAKAVRKELGNQTQALGLEFYRTRILEAMYRAGMLVDGAEMTRAQLNEWGEGAAGMQMISECTVAWITPESPVARTGPQMDGVREEGRGGSRMEHLLRHPGQAARRGARPC